MILNILDTIASDKSKNFKLDQLREHSNNEIFKKVVTLAYCPRTKFYLKQVPEIEVHKGTLELVPALNALTALSNREISGNEAKEYVSTLLEGLSEDDATVLKRVILKDLRAGFSASSVNKAMGKGTIEDTPYMGAVSYNEKKVAKLFKDHPIVVSEVKMDGRYTNVRITSDSVYMESRAGNHTDFGDAFDNLIEFRNSLGYDIVLNGELIIPGLDRYTSNGIIASIVSMRDKCTAGKSIKKDLEKFEAEHNCTLQEMAAKIQIVAWDFIPLVDYQKGYWNKIRDDRFMMLAPRIQHFDAHNLKYVEHKQVKNPAEAAAHFQELIARGEEGTILKGCNGVWKSGKPSHQVKFKLEMTVDMRITGFNYGTGKNAELISSIDVETSDKVITTSPAGIDEKTMQYITENQDKLMGSIVEVKCSGTSQNSKGEQSLLHPVFLKFRDDKHAADSSSDVEKNEAMIKGLA